MSSSSPPSLTTLSAMKPSTSDRMAAIAPWLKDLPDLEDEGLMRAFRKMFSNHTMVHRVYFTLPTLQPQRDEEHPTPEAIEARTMERRRLELAAIEEEDGFNPWIQGFFDIDDAKTFCHSFWQRHFSSWGDPDVDMRCAGMGMGAQQVYKLFLDDMMSVGFGQNYPSVFVMRERLAELVRPVKEGDGEELLGGEEVNEEVGEEVDEGLDEDEDSDEIVYGGMDDDSDFWFDVGPGEDSDEQLHEVFGGELDMEAVKMGIQEAVDELTETEMLPILISSDTFTRWRNEQIRRQSVKVFNKRWSV